MHLGLLTISRLAVANQRVFAAILVLILCVTFSLAPGSQQLLADDPEIADFEAHLDGNWIVVSGTVDATGWVQITGITFYGFNVIAGEHFIRQIPYVTGLEGLIFAVLHSFLGLSDTVSDVI